jgi:hypothetical protein
MVMDPNYIGATDADQGGFGSTWGKLKSGVVGRILHDLYTLPERAGQAAYDYGQTGQYNPAPIMEAAMTATTGGMPFAQSGAAGIFGGRLAATADKAALAKAEDMAAKGAPREQIWNDTGWFRGADDKWRFEIDDSASSLSTPAIAALQKANVGDLAYMNSPRRAMSHGGLHSAYPDLAGNVEITKGGGYPYQPSGYFQERASGYKTIGVDANDPLQARDVLLHELQHGVQRKEGFAPGAAAPEVTKRQEHALALVNDINKQYRPQLDALHSAGNMDEYARLDAKRLSEVDAVFDADRMVTGGLGYHRSAGEVEARNVSRRKNLTADQRKSIAPWNTEDVPLNQQIR